MIEAVFESLPSRMSCTRAVRPDAEVLGVSALDVEDDAGPAAVDGVAGLGVVGHVLHGVEVAGAGEAGDEVAAVAGVIQVVDGRGDVLDVGAHRIADHQRLDAGDDEDHHPHPRIADDLEELLSQHLEDPLEHGYESLFLNAALARTTMTTA